MNRWIVYDVKQMKMDKTKSVQPVSKLPKLLRAELRLNTLEWAKDEVLAGTSGRVVQWNETVARLR